MSADNVEIVRAYLHALAEGGLGATAEFWDPDISWRAIEGAPDAVHLTGRAKLSRVQTEVRYAVVYTVRDGKILRAREYTDREQALEAVGLPS